ncbi:class I SAM-dependent methyltransferase [Leucobacter insecticola]|uniref:Class I SAM-dependent methyltransferase n=1 Tax=Leucobacter insecticola TaxID=2714934 RepID=A0A6G8FL00_9MICO|nr:class I SAM-dependent methyltransferase [Leucobacter insecticola]QIM17160.1 class I SAM-dependent methyltransferase [Leucobacter insecticola]
MVDSITQNAARIAHIFDKLLPPDTFPPEAAEWILKVMGPDRKRILELGVGSGRILSRIAEHLERDSDSEYEFFGVDISPEMIASAASKRSLQQARFAVADIRSVQLNDEFSTILCLGNTLGMSLDESALPEICDTAFTHLRDRGLFIVDFQNPTVLNLLFQESPVVSNFQQEADQPSGHLQFFSQPNEQLFRVNQHWVDDQKVVSFVEELKLYPYQEVQRAAEEVGFVLNDLFGDYLGSPFEEESSFMCVMVFEKQVRPSDRINSTGGHDHAT